MTGRPLGDLAAADAFELLERAISYALRSVRAATSDQLLAPTPCAGWDLGTLLRHVNESLALLCTCVGANAGPVPDSAADPACVFRTRAARLLSAFSGQPCRNLVVAAGYPMPIGMIAATGAIEIAVHGWDVAQTTKQPWPVPNGLARDLLWVGPLIAADARHHRLFAPPIPLPATADAGDQLVALLGRDPGRPN